MAGGQLGQDDEAENSASSLANVTASQDWDIQDECQHTHGAKG
jgi:hypothetical protein